MDVKINQVILHILDAGASEPVLSDRPMELDADLYEYFSVCIEKAFASDDSKNCRFLPDSPFLQEMQQKMGNDAKFVLDIKQAVRSKEDPMQMLKTLGSGVVHVHMSDHGEYGDCLQIGAGRFAVKSFLQMLAQLSPNCTIILELYRSGFRTLQDLLHNDHILQRMIQSCQEKEE